MVPWWSSSRSDRCVLQRRSLTDANPSSAVATAAAQEGAGGITHQALYSNPDRGGSTAAYFGLPGWRTFHRG